VWRTGSLIEGFDFESMDPDAPQFVPPPSSSSFSAAAAAPPSAVMDVVVPAALQSSMAAPAKGKLGQLLQKERNSRQLAGGPVTSLPPRGASSASTALSSGGVRAPMAGGSRFRGVFQRTLNATQALPALPSSTAAAPGVSATTSGAAANKRSAPAGATQTQGAVDLDDGDAPQPVQCHMQHAKILRNPFATGEEANLQPAVKRNKKNITFSLVRNGILQ
jgi:hypothetical protein